MLYAPYKYSVWMQWQTVDNGKRRRRWDYVWKGNFVLVQIERNVFMILILFDGFWLAFTY